MTEPSSKKQGFKKCRSATFSIDGFSFTIGKRERNCRRLSDFTTSFNLITGFLQSVFWFESLQLKVVIISVF